MRPGSTACPTNLPLPSLHNDPRISETSDHIPPRSGPLPPASTGFRSILNLFGSYSPKLASFLDVLDTPQLAAGRVIKGILDDLVKSRKSPSPLTGEGPGGGDKS